MAGFHQCNHSGVRFVKRAVGPLLRVGRIDRFAFHVFARARRERHRSFRPTWKVGLLCPQLPLEQPPAGPTLFA